MEILYQDAAIAVVVKPRGVLSEESGTGDASLPALLAPALGKVFVVHRLDRAVGGVMVVARTPEAAASLTREIAAGEMKKEYTAVVSGVPETPAGELHDLLYHDARQNKTFVVERERKGAREAALFYRVEKTARAGDVTFSRVAVRLMTGRTHQIRVQFASRRMPLVGDGKYGSRVRAPFVALAATGLSFKHPTNGETLSFAAPLPCDYPWSLFGDSHYEIERKYLIAYPDVAQLAAMPACRVRAITQTYLKAPADVTDRVRKIEEGGETHYVRTTKRRVNAMRAVEEEETLSRADYEALLALADPALRPIVKTRYAFPFAGRIVEVDAFDFWRDRALAEVEIDDEGEEVALPAFLRVLRDVTGEKAYKNVNLARQLPKEEI